MKILAIDDDALNRGVLRSMLTVAGVAMIEAADAPAGLELVDAEGPDAVLMDLRMPDMDGLAAIRLIRARGRDGATLPVLVVTADAGLHVRADCLAAGADDVLLKPVEMTKLFSAIGQSMARRSGSVPA